MINFSFDELYLIEHLLSCRQDILNDELERISSSDFDDITKNSLIQINTDELDTINSIISKVDKEIRK